MSNILRKLTSRKLWMALAGVATGVCIALGGDASELQTVAGMVAAVISAITYVLTEGRVDAKALAQASEGALEKSSQSPVKCAWQGEGEQQNGRALLTWQGEGYKACGDMAGGNQNGNGA